MSHTEPDRHPPTPLDPVGRLLFGRVAEPGRAFAWGMYDVANQSFALLINTLLFSIYFKDVIVARQGDGTPIPPELVASGDRWWSAGVAVSMLIVVVLSPLVGAAADAKRLRKLMLIGTGVGCATLTVSLGLFPPGAVVVTLLIYMGANLCFQIGENVLASFLPSIARPGEMGRVSATGWAMGYAGALALIVIVVVANIAGGLDTPAEWRPLLVFAGLWFLAGITLPAVFLREPGDSIAAPGGIVRAAAERLAGTVRSASRFRELVIFLASFLLYAMGIQTVIFFAGIIAKEMVFTDPDSQTTKLFLFVAQLTVVAGVTAAMTAVFQDRLGAKRTAMAFLAVWIVSTGGLTAALAAGVLTEPVFWILGTGVGVGLGGIGTASRSIVAIFSPGYRSAEFFGLWGMVYKFAAVAGVPLFGLVRGLPGGDALSMGLLTVFFVAGLAVLLAVNERAGLDAAARAQLEAEADAAAR